MNRRWTATARIILAGMLVGVAGCATTPDYEPKVTRVFVEANPLEGYSQVLVLPLSKVSIPIDPKPVLSELDIVGVDLVRVDLGLCLDFRLTPAAGRDLYRLSVNRMGRRLVLTINGVPVGVRLMDRPFSYGSIMFFVEIPNDELDKLVADLQATAIDVQKAIDE
ncbi:MAG: hypothetical protein R3F07_17980 [Opitutaceae bacterium]